MSKKLNRFIVVCWLTITASGCSYFAKSSNEINSTDAKLSAPKADAINTDSRICRTFGFRNWTLLRSEGGVTVSGEAMMPTPAWTIILHQHASANDADVQLVMETLEPSDLSSTVIAWVNFEKTISTSATAKINVSVRCADEIIWTSSAD